MKTNFKHSNNTIEMEHNKNSNDIMKNTDNTHHHSINPHINKNTNKKRTNLTNAIKIRITIITINQKRMSIRK